MKLSISRSRESIWVWLLWCVGIYLVLELGPFIIAGLAFSKSVLQLVGPYLAFAVPCVILAPLIWWLKRWEEQGESTKRLARGWGLSVALFGIAGAAAFWYTCVALHLMNPMEALVIFVVMVLLTIPSATSACIRGQ